MGSKTTLHVTTLLGSLGPYYVTCYYAAEISRIVATLLVTTGFQFPIISVSKYQSQFPNTFFQFPNTTPSFRIPLSSFRTPLPVSEYQFPNTTRQFPNTTVTNILPCRCGPRAFAWCWSCAAHSSEPWLKKLHQLNQLNHYKIYINLTKD